MNQTTSKTSVSARRTYLLLSRTLFGLMADSPFERITLTDICNASLVPRSTFYRYFEDKYDLLHCCLRGLVDEVGLTEDVICFKNENMKQYRKIYGANQDGELMKILQNGLRQILTEKLEEAEKKGYRSKIPHPIFASLLADFYFGIIKCYLEMADQYDTETFIENVCLFSERDFFETEGGR